jgi:hypothetical protein
MIEILRIQFSDNTLVPLGLWLGLGVRVRVRVRGVRVRG